MTIDEIDIEATIEKAHSLVRDDKQMSAATKSIGCGSFATYLTIVSDSHDTPHFLSKLLDYSETTSPG